MGPRHTRPRRPRNHRRQIGELAQLVGEVCAALDSVQGPVGPTTADRLIGLADELARPRRRQRGTPSHGSASAHEDVAHRAIVVASTTISTVYSCNTPQTPSDAAVGVAEPHVDPPALRRRRARRRCAGGVGVRGPGCRQRASRRRPRDARGTAGDPRFEVAGKFTGAHPRPSSSPSDRQPEHRSAWWKPTRGEPRHRRSGRGCPAAAPGPMVRSIASTYPATIVRAGKVVEQEAKRARRRVRHSRQRGVTGNPWRSGWPTELAGVEEAGGVTSERRGSRLVQVLSGRTDASCSTKRPRRLASVTSSHAAPRNTHVDGIDPVVVEVRRSPPDRPGRPHREVEPRFGRVAFGLTLQRAAVWVAPATGRLLPPIECRTPG